MFLEIKKKTKKLRETNGLVKILSILVNKYKHFILYLNWQKRDFRDLILKYADKIPILKNNNIEDFQAITFLDCLFKIKFFTFSFQDPLLLVLTLTRSTGVVFVHLEESGQKIVDVSYLACNKFINYFENYLEEIFNQTEKTSTWSFEIYLTLYNITISFTAIWTDFSLNQTEEIRKEFTPILLKFLNKILYYLGELNSDYFDALHSLNQIENILGEHLKNYIPDKTIDIKKILESEVDVKMITLFDSMKIEHANLLDKKLENSEKSNKKINQETWKLKSPFTSATSVSFHETYRMLESKTTSLMRSINSQCHKKTESENFEKHFEAFVLLNFSSYLPRFDFTLNPSQTICYSLPKPLKINLTSGTNEDLNNLQIEDEGTNFTNFWNEKLKQIQDEEASQEQNNFNTNPSDPPKSEGIINNATPPNVPEQKKKENKVAKWVEYFYHENVAEKNDFNDIKRKVFRIIKHIHEKAYAEKTILMNNHEVKSSSALEKEIIDEIKQEMTKMTDFEKNMAYIIIEEFNTLKSFEYPKEFSEIKLEYYWIKENWEDYLDKLSLLKNSDDPSVESSNTKILTDEEMETLNVKGFNFCSGEIPRVSEKKEEEKDETEMTSSKSPDYSEENNRMFLIEDKIVESYIRVLYRQSSKELILLNQLCKSSFFEAKIIDFCFFLLYCPEHLSDLDDRIFYKNINKIYSQSALFNKVSVFTFDFLSKIFNQNQDLVYQPRIFLERNALKNLDNLKKINSFYGKTKDLVSWLDLCIGLLGVEKIKSEYTLNRNIEEFICNIFKKYPNLLFIEPRAGEDVTLEKMRLISKNCCEILIKREKFKDFFQDLILHNPESFIKNIEEKATSLIHYLEEQLSIFKTMKTNNEPIEKDLQSLEDSYSDFHNFEKLLGSCSSLLSVPLFDSIKLPKRKQIIWADSKKEAKLIKEATQVIKENLINMKPLEDLVILIFEIANITHDWEKDINESLRTFFVSICTHFYSLISIGTYQSQTHHHSQLHKISENIEFPTLSRFSSFDSVNDSDRLPEFTQTFSQLRKSGEYNFDILFTDLCRKNSEIIKTIIKDAFDSDVLGEIIEYFIICRKLPCALEFSSKKVLLLELIKKELKDLQIDEDYRAFTVDRENMIETSLAAFTNVPYKDLIRIPEVHFGDEEGFDGGGLTREWLTLLGKELFDPNSGLFRLAENKISIQPSPLAKLVPSHSKYLEFAGLMIGKAIREDSTIDVTFTKSLLKHVLGRRIGFNDLEDIDLELAKSLRWILNNSVEGLEQPFTYERDFMGQKETVELIPNGYNIIVTDENKKEYVRKICESKMKEEIYEDLTAFLKGIHFMIPKYLLDLFSPSEFQLLIAGVPNIDVNELKQYAEYIDYDKDCDMMKWLWEIFEEFSQKDLGAFMFFISGSLKLRHKSLQDNPIQYKRSDETSSSLPIAHTCYLQIEIPEYKSKEEFKQKLLLAIYEGQESFMIY